jgi:hypothetical protein
VGVGDCSKGVGERKGSGVAVPAVPPPVVSNWRKPTKAANRISRGQRMATLRIRPSLGQRRYLVRRVIGLSDFRQKLFYRRSGVP